MDHLPQLLALLAVHWLAMASPGPNVLLVSRVALAHSRRHAFAAALGVALGSLVWSGLTVVGFAVVLVRFPWLHAAITLAGGAYLVWLGIGMWRRADAPPAFDAAAPAARAGLGASFLKGLATNLTNPKSVVYFTGVFAAFLTPDAPGWLGPAAVGLVFVSACLWHALLAHAFSRPGARRAYGRAKGGIDRAAGAVMTLFGARLLLTAR